MVITSRYVVLSDERKEGLMRLTFHEPTGAIIAGFEDAITVTGFECTYYRQGNLPSEADRKIADLHPSAAGHEERLKAVAKLSPQW